MTQTAELNPVKRLEKLLALLKKKIVNGNWIYLVLNHIDPDSLGAGFGMKHLLKRSGFDHIKILYCGEAGDDQNRFILNDMALMERMAPLSDEYQKFADGDVIALLDSASVTDKRLGEAAGKFKATIVVDHHRDSEYDAESDDNFILIEDRKSCVGMVVELIKAIGFDFSGKGDEDLAILMALGILTDNGTHIGDAHDAQAYADILPYCNLDQLALFVEYPLSENYINAEQRALNNRIEKGSIVLTNIGSISAAERVFIARMADKMIRRLGYTLAIVWGWVDDQEIAISARSADSTSPLSEYLRLRFGERSGAKLAPGERISKGAAQISWTANGLLIVKSREHFLKGISAFIEEKVFDS